MSYQERVDEENKNAISEGRKPAYLQPSTDELREVLFTGEMYGKCLRCNVFGKVIKVEGHYRCEKCGA